MPTYNILDKNTRLAILEEILSDENRMRKEESLKRQEIYKKKQAKYILDALKKEFGGDSVKDMRTLKSINLVTKIVDEKGSIYKAKPVRTFSKDGEPIADAEAKQCENIYELGAFNVTFKKANRQFKLHGDQSHVQVIPKGGKICLRALAPHHLDVIPSQVDPSHGEVYIISSFDRSMMLQTQNLDLQGEIGPRADGVNQNIGDNDDWKKLANMRFVWWSNEYNFVTNGHGNFVDDYGNEISITEESEVLNPIGSKVVDGGRHPFVEISYDKDMDMYWNNAGSNVSDFAIDFGVLLSDLANILRLQGYAQAVINSVKTPEVMNLGPTRVLHIPQDPKSEIQPSFEFVAPSPNIDGSLAYIESVLSMFLSSEGLDPKTISGKLEGKKFNSGIERLLAMIEMFEASQDDIDTFIKAEDEVFDVARLWSNAFQGVNDENALVPELKLAAISPEVKLDIKYSKPEMIQTIQEKTDTVIMRMENGLMSRKTAIMTLDEVSEDKAKEIIQEIDKDIPTVVVADSLTKNVKVNAKEPVMEV